MTREDKNIITLTGCSHALSHAYLLIFPAVLLLLKEEFSMGYLGLGIIGNIMTFTYGLGSLPGGMVYNRFGPKKLYLLCFLGCSFASLLVAFSPNFIFFTAGLALLGALGSVYHPLANSLITAKVKEYGKGLGIHGAAGNLGLSGAPFLAGLIASQWGWRWAYILFAIPGFVLSFWSLFINMSMLPRQKAAAQAVESHSPSRPRTQNLWIYFSLPLIFIYVVNMLNSFCFHGAVTFLPAYMAKYTSFRIFSLDSVAIGGMLSGIALLMGVVGQLVGGSLGQKPHLDRNILLFSLLSFPFILSMSFTQDVILFFMALLFFFFTFCLQPMCNIIVAHHTTLEMRGTAYGLFFCLSFAIGSLSSSFSGYLAQNFGLPWVFQGLSAMTLLMAAFSYFLMKWGKPILRGEGEE